jgi:hypothetical protein
MFWTTELSKPGDTDLKVLVACPTYAGCAYALREWAEAFHAFTYPNKGALMVDNSDENLHYTHLIRAQGIPAIYQWKRFNFLWDTLELSWRLIAEYAHEHDYDLIWSVEADVVCEPDALSKMVAKYLEVGPKAIISHRYHPRGLDNPEPPPGAVINEEKLEQLKKECYFDTLGCTLFPTELAYKNRDHWMAIFEVEIYLQAQDHGYERHRIGDLFEIRHLEDPERGMKLAVPRPWTNRAHGAELGKKDEEPAPEAHLDRPLAVLPQGSSPDAKWHGRRVDAGGQRQQFGDQPRDIAGKFASPDEARQAIKYDCLARGIEDEKPEVLRAKIAHKDMLINQLFAEIERMKGEDRRER